MVALSTPVCPQCQQTTQSPQTSTASFCAHCQFPLMEVAGKYQLLEELARGGHGVVYKALHRQLVPSQERAIKFIKPSRCRDSAVMIRFRQEIQVTAALSQGNIHVVRIFDDFGEVPHMGHYYVMEYLKGPTLGEWLEEHPAPLPLAVCANIFCQLCDAMEHAHRKKVLHRDLKPNNLMLLLEEQDNPLLKVLDFGIAKILQTAQESAGLTGQAIGTPQYMAPELCLNRDTDERTDIYAMGLILFELLVGHSPFVRPGISMASPSPEELFAAHLYRTPPLLSIVCPPKTPRPEALDGVLAIALSKSPDQRFQSISDFRGAFLDALPTSAAGHHAPYRIPQIAYAVSPPHANQEAAFHAHDIPGETLPPDALVLNDTPSRPPLGEKLSPLPTDEALSLPRAALLPTPSTPSTPTSMTMPQRPSLVLWLFGLVGLGLILVVGSRQLLGTPEADTRPLHPSERPSPGPVRPAPQVSVASISQRPKVAGLRTLSGADHLPSLQPGSGPGARPKVGGALRMPHADNSVVPGQVRPDAHPIVRPSARSSARSRRRLSAQHKKRLSVRSSRRLVVRRSVKRRKTSHRKRNPHTRYAAGCPRQALFWVRIEMLPQQRRVRPWLPGSRIIPHKEGFCVGIRTPQGSMRLGHANEGFIPCVLPFQALPSVVRVRLQPEGQIEPSSSAYCLQP